MNQTKLPFTWRFDKQRSQSDSFKLVEGLLKKLKNNKESDCHFSSVFFSLLLPVIKYDNKLENLNNAQ
jgi:hypothetical protein